jgi:tRNA U54 and U55 pseudouridine synthase Pus10
MDKNNEIGITLCNECYTSLSQTSPNSKIFINIHNKYNLCTLCFGFMNKDIYKDIIVNIQNKLKEYEQKSLKLITNFSCLFELFYWKTKFALSHKTNSEINKEIIILLTTSSLRKIFKPFFIQWTSSELNIHSQDHSDMELIINFNFRDDLYLYLNSEIKNILIKNNDNDVNITTEHNFTINSTDDKSKITYIQNHTLNTQLFNVLDKVDISSNIYVCFSLNPNLIYISGYYIKLSRELGQTAFIKEGIKLFKSSINDEMNTRLSKFYRNDSNDFIFSGGGREDRDVRMLGNGRQFIYEIHNSKIKNESLCYSNIQKEFNDCSSLVKIKKLEACNKKHFLKLKTSEDQKQKKYVCVIYIEKQITQEIIEIINSISNLNLIQKTPLRVLHKRVLKDRNKTIIKCKVTNILNPHFILLEIISSAGTYIKEFIHSDLGRTHPSLCSLLECNCDILQLDVLDIIY